jgi:3-deoxy-manno-octulosonate cytidylyltransferase (CMP-KDO synthetase)
MIRLPQDYQIVIPARFSSTRYPGKPLALIEGIPMVVHVALNCLEIADRDQVIVATDDERISKIVESYEIRCVETSKNHLTGTDRVSEVSKNSSRKSFINVQGDEPLVSGKDILKVVKLFESHKKRIIATGYCDYEINFNEDSKTVPKLVTTEDNKLLYVSRLNIPFDYDSYKNNLPTRMVAKRQVCIYVFPAETLKKYSDRSKRTYLEGLEDIEILRFLELGEVVRVVKVNDSRAVDTPEDLEAVKKLIAIRNKYISRKLRF